MPEVPVAAPGQKTGYQVRLAVFEGPLDLLLHLIEREELDITRVSLVRVTDQYLDYLRALEELQVEDLSDFVAVAARLLLIKSQALLPRPPAPMVDEEQDLGDELLRQLHAYKRFKEAAKHLEARQVQGQRSYIRLAPQPAIQAGIEHLEPVSLEALLNAAHSVMRTRRTPTPAPNVVVPITLSIDDQIELVTRRLAEQPYIDFIDLLSHEYSRQEIAVTLLAVLELIKRHKARASQERMFGRIIIHPATPVA